MTANYHGKCRLHVLKYLSIVESVNINSYCYQLHMNLLKFSKKILQKNILRALYAMMNCNGSCVYIKIVKEFLRCELKTLLLFLGRNRDL